MTHDEQQLQLRLIDDTPEHRPHAAGEQLDELPGETWEDIFDGANTDTRLNAALADADPRAAELAATIQEARKRALCSVGSPARATSGGEPSTSPIAGEPAGDAKVRSHPPVHPCGGDVLERSDACDSGACDTHTGASMSSSARVDDGEAGAAHARPTPRQQTSHPPASNNGSLGRSRISRVLSDG